MGRSRYTLDDITKADFYQLPKFLFNEEFKDMSNDARVLYALMKDRFSLSMKNGWVNENGEVYLIFSRTAIMEMLGVSKKTAIKYVKELEDFGLIEDVEEESGMANRIYLLALSGKGRVEEGGCKKYTGVESAPVPGVKSIPGGVEKVYPNKTNISKTINKKEKENDMGENVILHAASQVDDKYESNLKKLWSLTEDVLRTSSLNFSVNLRERLEEFIRNYNPELIFRIIQQYDKLDNKHSLKGYIDSVLQDLEKEGIKSVEEFEKYLEDRKVKSSGKSSSKPIQCKKSKAENKEDLSDQFKQRNTSDELMEFIFGNVSNS